MSRLSRAALFGLLWLAVSATAALATPLLSIDLVLDDDDATVFPESEIANVRYGGAWALDPAYYLTIPQRLHTVPDLESVANQEALPSVEPVDLSEVTGTSTTFALSGAGLVALGMIRRKKS